MNTSPRFYHGQPIGYTPIQVRHWVGGKGYIYVEMYRVWNPANPKKTEVFTSQEFDHLFAPRVRMVA